MFTTISPSTGLNQSSGQKDVIKVLRRLLPQGKRSVADFEVGKDVTFLHRPFQNAVYGVLRHLLRHLFATLWSKNRIGLGWKPFMATGQKQFSMGWVSEGKVVSRRTRTPSDRRQRPGPSGRAVGRDRLRYRMRRRRDLHHDGRQRRRRRRRDPDRRDHRSRARFGDQQHGGRSGRLRQRAHSRSARGRKRQRQTGTPRRAAPAANADGSEAAALGLNSNAIGSNATATWDFADANGGFATATGGGAFANGGQATATGTNSTANGVFFFLKKPSPRRPASTPRPMGITPRRPGTQSLRQWHERDGDRRHLPSQRRQRRRNRRFEPPSERRQRHCDRRSAAPTALSPLRLASCSIANGADATATGAVQQRQRRQRHRDRHQQQRQRRPAPPRRAYSANANGANATATGSL